MANTFNMRGRFGPLSAPEIAKNSEYRTWYRMFGKPCG
jgi:hypothetical protein